MDLTKSNKWAVPFYLLTAYLIVVLLRPHEYKLSPIIDVPILPALMIAGFLAWFIHGRRDFDAPQFNLAPLLLGIMCLSMIASGWMGGALLIFRRYLPVIGLFFLIACIADSPKRVKLLFQVIVYAVTVMAWHGITQVVTGVGWSGAEVLKGRITYVGIFNDPNDLGLLFIATIPVLLYLFSEARFIGSRILLFACFGSILYATYLTNSRGTILGLMTTAGFYFWQRYGVIRTAFLVAITGPLAFILAPSRFKEIGAGGAIDESAFNRFEAWYAGLNMFKSNPVLGIGAERFPEFFQITAHNSFIVVLAETGFLGAYVWSAFLGLSIYMMYRYQKAEIPAVIAADAAQRVEYEGQQKISRTLMYSLLAFCSAALFLSRSYDITLFIWCGLVVAHYQNCRRRWPEEMEIISFKGNAMKVFWFWLFTVGISYVGMKIALAVR